MALKRFATAHWEGDLKGGQGRISTPASGLLTDTRYGYNTRFGNEKGIDDRSFVLTGPAERVGVFDYEPAKDTTPKDVAAFFDDLQLERGDSLVAFALPD